MRDARGGTRSSKAELRLGELNRPSKTIITQKLLVILAPSEPTLDLRLLQAPDLHHFLGNCPGRSQKFVAPHSEHAYFGTSDSCDVTVKTGADLAKTKKSQVTFAAFNSTKITSV